MKKYFIFLIFFLVVFPLLVFSQGAERVTIATYYPAPFGVYQRLAASTLGIGDTNGDGVINELDTPNPAAQAGDLWVAGNVGIGTTDPQERLDVNGGIKIGVTGTCGNSADGCSAATAGAMRYCGSIEYCNGTAWGSIVEVHRARTTISALGILTGWLRHVGNPGVTNRPCFAYPIDVTAITIGGVASSSGGGALTGTTYGCWYNPNSGNIEGYALGVITCEVICMDGDVNLQPNIAWPGGHP